LVEILHAGVLAATDAQRRRLDQHGVERQPSTQRQARRPRGEPSVTRVTDRNGAVSFGTRATDAVRYIGDMIVLGRVLWFPGSAVWGGKGAVFFGWRSEFQGESQRGSYPS
jgi:hypothetical protein